MEALDTSIANVALPHIAGALAASVDESTWILTSYLVSNAIVLPMSAWLSTRFGRKHFYMSCVALFTVSSLLCGLAPSLAILIAFRVLQGAGGGGLQPSEQAILADTFPPAQRGMAFAIYGMAIVVAPALGPTLGGWITDNYSWRWIFFINIPVGITSLILTYHMIEDPPQLVRERKLARRQGMRIDYIGLALLALTFGPLQVVLDKGEEDDRLQSHFIVVFATIALVALITGVIWELYQKDPVVDLRLFKNRNFAASSILFEHSNVRAGLSALRYDCAAPRIRSATVGLHGTAGGKHAYAGRPGAYSSDASRGIPDSAGGRPMADCVRCPRAFRFTVSHNRDRSRNQLVERDDAPLLSGECDCVSVRAYQHGFLRGHEGGAKQSGIGTDEPDEEHRRKHRDFTDRSDGDRARTISPGSAGSERDLLQSKHAGITPEFGEHAGAGGAQHARRATSGIGQDLRGPPNAGADARLYRYLLGLSAHLAMPGSARAPFKEGRTGSGVCGSLSF
jgi:multidrug resistance protein